MRVGILQILDLSGYNLGECKNFARRLFRVIAYNFKDSLKELEMKKCGLTLDTLEFISAGIYSGLRVEDEEREKMKVCSMKYLSNKICGGEEEIDD